MKIPKLPFIGGSEEGWLGFWGGALGALIGIVGAYLVMREQINVEKKQKEEELNPILTLGKGDMVSLEHPIQNSNLISIPIINGGQTPVFNLRVSYVILEETLLNVEKNEDKKNISNNFFSFDDGDARIMMPTTTEIKYISVLMPGEKQEIDLGMGVSHFYFYYVENTNKNEINRVFNTFNIKIVLDYQDYKNKKRKNDFILSIHVNSIEYSSNDKVIKLRCHAQLDNLSN